jgi:hypothetical protein
MAHDLAQLVFNRQPYFHGDIASEAGISPLSCSAFNSGYVFCLQSKSWQPRF